MNLDKKYKYKFSIVMAIYNVEKYLEEAILSVVNQDIGFEENVQLILVNDGSPDRSDLICKKYKELYPNNIVYIEKENGGVSSARNEGMKYIEGKYMNFLDSDDKLELNSLKLVYEFFEKAYRNINIVTIPIHYFEGKSGGHTLNYKYKTTKEVNLLREYNMVQLSSSSSFFKSELKDRFKFNESMKYAEDGELINKILLETDTMGVVRQARYWYRYRLHGNSAIQSSLESKEWYNNYLKTFSLELIRYSLRTKGYVPEYIQYTIMYDLQWRFQIPQIDSKVLNNDEISEFMRLLKEILYYIEDGIILEQKNLNIAFKKYILKLKKGSQFNSELTRIYLSNNIELMIGTKTIGTLNNEILKVDFVEIHGTHLKIEGGISNIILEENYEIYLELNGVKFEAELVDRKRNSQMSLGNIINKMQGFKAEIDLDKNSKTQELKIYIKYNNTVFRPKINMGKFITLDRSLSESYFITDKYRVMFKYNTFIFLKNSFKVNLGREYRLSKQLIKKREIKSVIIRLLYFTIRSIYKKRIWLFMDRIDKADDNAEHLFRYSIKQKDDIKKYYVISKKTSDYNRLKKCGKVVEFNSLYHKFLILLSEKVIASHIEDNIRVPFRGKGTYLRSLVDFEFVFLQHGITKDDVSGWLNKYNKNINLFITAVNKEYESILNGDYFYNEEVVKLTGFPRFDNLLNDAKKQILIMPTWRNNIVNQINQETGKRPYNENFKNSDYFKAYNDLINNERLLNIAEKNGYTIKFFPHPAIQQQICDFDRNNKVIFVDYNESYQTLFDESDLLITDYSSVAFDFAYLKKPVIYYQFDKETFFGGHTYSEGYFSYENMGFGSVCFNKDELLEEIFKNISNKCEMPYVYKERVEKFYKYTDRKNCERVYDEIKKLQ